MRGAWGSRVVVSIAITGACFDLSAQQVKASPSHLSLSNPAAVSENSDDLKRDTTFSLVKEAYATSRDLPSEQRIPLLSEICEVAASITSSRSWMESRAVRARHADSKQSSGVELTTKQVNHLRDWTEELFQLGDVFPSG